MVKAGSDVLNTGKKEQMMPSAACALNQTCTGQLIHSTNSIFSAFILHN